MQKISSGIDNLDRLIDSFYKGDNVVWQVDSGVPYHVFIQNFIRQSIDEAQKIIYVSFNRSPQSILKSVETILNPDHFTLVDCFTSGKGKNDQTFIRFYDKAGDIKTVRIDDPKDIEKFTETLNAIEDSFLPGARYVFDSLTGMQDLWGNEDDTYRFFTYMCPRLYDLDTVAYWILDKEAHSQKFKANLRHITQVVFDLYKRRELLYIKAIKLDSRQNREAFKSHFFEIDGKNVIIKSQIKEPSNDIGGQLKEARISVGITQQELANKIHLSRSFISQIENDQISPSLSSFLHICSTLGIDPGNLLKEKKAENKSWLIKRDKVLSSAELIENGIRFHTIVSDEKKSALLCIFSIGTSLNRHFYLNKSEEFVYVLQGYISVTVRGVEEVITAGDSVYLRKNCPVKWENKGGEEVQLLVAC